MKGVCFNGILKMQAAGKEKIALMLTSMKGQAKMRTLDLQKVQDESDVDFCIDGEPHIPMDMPQLQMIVSKPTWFISRAQKSLVNIASNKIYQGAHTIYC